MYLLDFVLMFTEKVEFLAYWKCHGQSEMVDSRDVESAVSQMSSDVLLQITTGMQRLYYWPEQTGVVVHKWRKYREKLNLQRQFIFP